MWLDDVLTALKSLPEHYRSRCCFNAIKAGYKKIVFETDTFILIYHLDTAEWEYKKI